MIKQNQTNGGVQMSKMSKRIIFVGLILCLMIVSTVGCATNQASNTQDQGSVETVESPAEEPLGEALGEEAQEPESNYVIDLTDITIGASVMSLQHEFMANLVTGYNEFQRQTGVNLIITDGGNMEPEKQVVGVENYIIQNVDGILAQCISVDTMKDTLQRALAQGIPVGIYPWDTSVGATTYFGYNEHSWGYSLGETAAEWINTKLGGKATILNLSTSLEPSAVERRQGWVDALTELIGNENIEWIEVEATSSEDAQAVVESSLQANPNIDMVLVFNDEMGVGAYNAVEQSGLDTTNMFVGSCDGTDTVLDLVAQDSVYRCTVGNDRYVTEIGFYWVQEMVKIVLGMPYDDPFPITTISITADNVDEYRSREPSYVIDQEVIDFVNNMDK